MIPQKCDQEMFRNILVKLNQTKNQTAARINWRSQTFGAELPGLLDSTASGDVSPRFKNLE
jgi:hypothetical protein